MFSAALIVEPDRDVSTGIEGRPMRAGADVLLTKPVDIDLFALTVDELYARAAAARAQSVQVRDDARAAADRARALIADWRAHWIKNGG